MKYIDIHSHLHDEPFDHDRVEVLGRMRDENLGTITVGTGLMSSRKAVALAEKEAGVWASIGVHPNDDPCEEFDMGAFTGLASNPNVVAIGECGFDFFKTDKDTDYERQRILFEQHLVLAEKTGLPLMLHVRDAYEETLEVLSGYKGNVKGNVHFFAGSIPITKRFLDLGFTCSFTGVISFTRDYDDIIRYIPDDMIHAETDAPYVTPVPHRGKRNEPTYVKFVAERIGEIKEWTPEYQEKTLLQNTTRVFIKNIE